jgi:hypothetical protein
MRFEPENSYIKFDNELVRFIDYTDKEFYELYKRKSLECKEISYGDFDEEGKECEFVNGKPKYFRIELGIGLIQIKDIYKPFIPKEDLRIFNEELQLIFVMEREFYCVYQRGRVRYTFGNYYTLGKCFVYTEIFGTSMNNNNNMIMCYDCNTSDSLFKIKDIQIEYQNSHLLETTNSEGSTTDFYRNAVNQILWNPRYFNLPFPKQSKHYINTYYFLLKEILKKKGINIGDLRKYIFKFLVLGIE